MNSTTSLAQMLYRAMIFLSRPLSPVLKACTRISDAVRQFLTCVQLGSHGNGIHIYFPVHIEPKNRVFLEDGVSIAPFVQMWAAGGIRVGKNTMIGSHVVISTSTHDYNVSPMNSSRIDLPITIGDDVWIGSGTVILPGVTIGSGAVVGAGSVVTKDIEMNTIVAGVPAKELKQRHASNDR